MLQRERAQRWRDSRGSYLAPLRGGNSAHPACRATAEVAGEGMTKFKGDPMSLQETPKKRARFDRQGHKQPLKTAQIRKKTVKIQKFSRAHIWWCCPTSTLHIPHFSLKIPKSCLENTKKHIKLTKFFLTGKMCSSYKCIQDASRVSLFTFLIQTADKGTISAEGYKHGRDKRSHGHSRGVGVSWSVARNSL